MRRRNPKGTPYGQKVVARLIEDGAHTSSDAMRSWLLECPAISAGAKCLIKALLDQGLIELKSRKDPTHG